MCKPAYGFAKVQKWGENFKGAAAFGIGLRFYPYTQKSLLYEPEANLPCRTRRCNHRYF